MDKKVGYKNQTGAVITCIFRLSRLLNTVLSTFKSVSFGFTVSGRKRNSDVEGRHLHGQKKHCII